MRKARRQASRGRRNSRIRLTDGIMDDEEEEGDDRDARTWFLLYKGPKVNGWI